MASTVSRLGILAAMPQEVAKLKANVAEQEVHKRGEVFEFITGTLAGRPVVFGAANVRRARTHLSRHAREKS